MSWWVPQKVVKFTKSHMQGQQIIVCFSFLLYSIIKQHPTYHYLSYYYPCMIVNYVYYARQQDNKIVDDCNNWTQDMREAGSLVVRLKQCHHCQSATPCEAEKLTWHFKLLACLHESMIKCPLLVTMYTSRKGKLTVTKSTCWAPHTAEEGKKQINSSNEIM